MVLRRGMRSPVKAAARTAMSTGFSFAPARRRSREAQGALNLLRTASTLATAAARPAGCGGMLSKGVYKRRKPSVPVGRVASLPQRVTAIPQIDPTASAHQEASERWLRHPCEMPAESPSSRAKRSGGG
jgi:hypothetical protein